jgi:hypothetical protein
MAMSPTCSSNGSAWLLGMRGAHINKAGKKLLKARVAGFTANLFLHLKNIFKKLNFFKLFF